jgi:hypothetical protein
VARLASKSCQNKFSTDFLCFYHGHTTKKGVLILLQVLCGN